MFKSARLTLTAWYLLIIMCISTFFSLLIYRALTNELDRFANLQRFRIERRFSDSILAPPSIGYRMMFVDPELIEDTKRRIGFVLIIINSGILIISGATGYFLAGRTLLPIKEMVDEQNRFISDSSHELKTPLTSLKSSMEVFLRTRKPTMKEAKSVMEESIGEVDKLQSLTESLLMLTQFQKPNSQDKCEKISLTEIIKDAIKKMSPIAAKKKIAIDFHSLDWILYGNRYSLTDLFVILIDNAIKYSFESSRVLIYTKKIDGMIEVSVKDEGIGISKKDLPRIFDRFYRADMARTKNQNGSYGLGLSIAQKIIEMHKGVISVESQLKKGSTFYIRLPIIKKD